MDFTHLHVHSHYSLLDGLPKIDDLITAAKKKGFSALALTDHGAMYGAIEFYKKAASASIKPIIGVEAYLAVDLLSDKRARIDNDYYHIILLAKNFDGYKNLLKLTTIAHLDGFYYHPRIDKTLLKQYGQNLICLSGCMRGDINRSLLAGELEKAKKLVAEYKQIFGDDFYLEIQRHESANPEYGQKEKNLNDKLVRLSAETGTPLVATNDSHYIARQDAEAQDLMVCVGLGKTVTDPNRIDMRSSDLSLKSKEEMAELFADLPEALGNTKIVADKCDLKISLNRRFFPNYPLPEGLTANNYLKRLAYEGLKQRLLPAKHSDPEIIQRLDYELEVIINKNYSEYFLVVADFVNWARNQGIIATTRGSAAGSLVSFALGITTVNPLDYKLPFERFLNPLRPSPPDIDMDFADSRRDEVIKYVTEKYGEDRVAQIVTFGTMMARAAVRDIGRALGIAYTKCDKIAKMIPFGKYGFHMTIEKALDQSPEFQEAYNKDPETKRLIDLARKVEGAARHASVHAAGIVIAPTALTDYTPLQRDQDGKIITQYDMYSIEEAGLVKMDFLGIRNLSILGSTVEIAKHTKGIDVDLQNLPLDDQKTYQLLSLGKTMGLFQLGGSGMTRYLKELSPTNIFDIMAMISLYRPGPIESIPEFIKRKHNPKLISFSDPRLKDILSVSYGIITFQDDVLLIAVEIAGYTWEEADKLRRAMGKKIPKEMAAQKEKFIEGCVEKSGYSREKAQNLWTLIEPFAAYGFNKAHAASYAIVAYQTAYMKANFPVEFMAAVMTAEAGDPVTIAAAVEECKTMGIEILPPDINESLANFTVIDNTHIRFGFNAIKNLGSDVINSVIAERKAGGKFKDLEDFITRVQTRNFNKKSWEALVKSGAMDIFGERNQLLGNTEAILEFSRSFAKSKIDSQASLFNNLHLAVARLKLRDMEQASEKDKLAWEKELLGLYVTAHPLDEYAAALKQHAVPIKSLDQVGGYGQSTIGGIINRVQKIITKKGELMAFVELEDLGAVVEVLVFPGTYQKYKDLIMEERIVLISGRVSDKDGIAKFLADEIRELSPASPASPTSHTITVRVPDNASDELFLELKKLFELFPGSLPVDLLIKGQKVKTPFRINLTEDLKKSIIDLTKI